MGAQGDCNHLPYDELHRLRRKRGYAREDSKAALETRLSTMGAMGRKRSGDTAGAVDASRESLGVRGKRRRVDDLHLAFVAEEKVVAGHAQWRDPRMRGQRNAAKGAPLELANAVVSAWLKR